MVEGRSDEYLAGESGVWRHRVPALGRAERRQQTRHVLQPYGRASELQAGAAVWFARQGRHRSGFRCRHRARGPARKLLGSRHRVRIQTGLFALRGAPTHGPGQDHLLARHPDLRWRQNHWTSARSILTAARLKQAEPANIEKSRHGSWRPARKRPVESERQLTYADAGRLVESVGAPSPPNRK